MRTAGGERVISALCAIPKMRARAVISALPAMIKRQGEEELYRVYVSDTLKIAAENISRIGGGMTLQSRYIELINPPEEETRTAEEIIDHVRRRGWGGEA